MLGVDIHAIDNNGDTNNDAALYDPTRSPRLLWLMPLLRAYLGVLL